jgi:predicted DNA-binding protein (UPF0251 family)
MARPYKCCKVAFVPGVTYFKPAGIPLPSLEEVRLSVEEAEALRLKDIEGMEQEQGARMMNISRSTFQRILVSAHQKIADALLNGKALRIDGGNFEVTTRRFRCRSGHEWDVETKSGDVPEKCPMCRSADIHPAQSAAVSCVGRQQGRYGRPRYCATVGHFPR